MKTTNEARRVDGSAASPYTMAYLNAHAARDPREALQEALERLYERDDYEDLQATVENQKKELEEAENDFAALEDERDEALAKLATYTSQDDKAAAVEKALQEVADAKNDASHWREMYDRALVREKQAVNDRTFAEQKWHELCEAMRVIVGDSPDAAALVAYWHGQAMLHGQELTSLRLQVKELGAPSSRNRSTKQLEADRDYWKALCMKERTT